MKRQAIAAVVAGLVLARFWPHAPLSERVPRFSRRLDISPAGKFEIVKP